MVTLFQRSFILNESFFHFNGLLSMYRRMAFNALSFRIIISWYRDCHSKSILFWLAYLFTDDLNAREPCLSTSLNPLSRAHRAESRRAQITEREDIVEIERNLR